LARYDRAFVPLLSFSTKQYYRVFGKIEHAGKITELLKDFGYVNYCPVCGDSNIGRIEKTDSNNHVFKNCGLVYLGKINNKKFCEDVFTDIKKRDFKLKKDEERLLKLLIDEADMPPFYYDLHFLAKKLKIEVPKFEILIKKLKENGFKVSRTHFCLTAIKTDSGYKNLCNLILQ